MKENRETSETGESRKGAVHPSAGIQMGFFTWMGMLARHHFRISPRAIPAALNTTAASLIYGFLGTLQKIAFKQEIDERTVRAPVFVIGHWRSGTTFLHELLCLDPRHDYPSTYACMNPHHFLLTQRQLMDPSGSHTSLKRPMDNMEINSTSPQEDEFALLSIGARSPYEALLFPSHLMRTRKYLDLHDVPEKIRMRWSREFMRFMKQIMQGRDRRLVIKSPTHTFRLDILSDMFPDARFIHIVRNPYTVFASTCNLWKKMFALYGFNRASEDAIEKYVIENWLLMEKCLDRAKGFLNSENYRLIKYEKFVADTETELARIYELLDLGDFETVRPGISAFLADRKEYKTNRFRLSDRQKQLVNASWGSIFTRYGYPMEP